MSLLPMAYFSTGPCAHEVLETTYVMGRHGAATEWPWNSGLRNGMQLMHGWHGVEQKGTTFGPLDLPSAASPGTGLLVNKSSAL